MPFQQYSTAVYRANDDLEIVHIESAVPVTLITFKRCWTTPAFMGHIFSGNPIPVGNSDIRIVLKSEHVLLLENVLVSGPIGIPGEYSNTIEFSYYRLS